jgi:ubiquinone/menaquinone biosynthesis C-methylase UbiE
MTTDNSAGMVVAKDVMQYVNDKQLFMSEVHRVLAPGGILISETPSTDCRGAFQDPAASSFWNENSFWYCTRPEYAYKVKNKRMFRECKLTTQCRDEFAKDNRMPYVIAHLEKIEGIASLRSQLQGKKLT